MDACQSHSTVEPCKLNNVNNDMHASRMTNSTSYQGNIGTVNIDFSSQAYDGIKPKCTLEGKMDKFSEFPSETRAVNDSNIQVDVCESDQSQILYVGTEVEMKSAFNSMETQMTPVISADSINSSVLFTSQALQSLKYECMCRICACETDKYIPLFGSEGTSLGLIDKIHHCLPIKISESDGFPQQICNSCASKLQTSHELLNISVAGDAKLKALSLMVLELPVRCSSTKDSETEENDATALSPKILETSSTTQTFKREFSEICDDVNQQCFVLTDEADKRPWSCPECDYKASRQTALALHMQNKHNFQKNELHNHNPHETDAEKLEFICVQCKKGFGSETKLKKHTLMHTKLSSEEKAATLSCTFCSEKFSTLKMLREHVKSSHNVEEEPKYNCDKCDKSYRLASSLDIHRATHSNETPYLCDVCGKSFKHGSNLRCHRRSHVDGQLTHRFSCERCPKKFPSRFQLSEHTNVHLNIKPYACGVCGKKFHRRIQLRQHRIIHNSDSSYECPQCGVCFNRRGNMTQHMKRHSKEPKYVCKVCTEPFQSLSEVVQHRREHTEKETADHMENGEFSCTKCQKSFSSSGDLDEHSKSHSDIKFECEICKKTLSNRRTLDYHIRCFHTQERPFSCQYCSESFVSREGCTVHERIHTGEKPYSCSKCKMTFRCSRNLSQHLSTHSDDRPWSCEHCPKTFKRKGILLVHMRTHTGEKPFCCEICGRRFAQKNDMLKHQHTHSSAKQTFLCAECSWPFHTRKELNKHRRTHHSSVEVQTNATIAAASTLESQALLIRDDLSQFPVTILEEGSNLIVHQIEELGKQTQIVELNPNEPNSHIIHFTDSLLQTVVPQYQILTVQAPCGQQMVHFDGSPSVTTSSTIVTSSSSTSQQSWPTN
ncbi:Zinc finger protein 420 [Frankliniella fusca]|uniref:Zinc finger protein 420 n=1 Tax=Frankliniella fusca TaxID=407009 RepID=A0AAE1LB74_9NEOP|nr:Zinc finger protein 420 [Frankliniella fusca]